MNRVITFSSIRRFSPCVSRAGVPYTITTTNRDARARRSDSRVWLRDVPVCRFSSWEIVNMNRPFTSTTRTMIAMTGKKYPSTYRCPIVARGHEPCRVRDRLSPWKIVKSDRPFASTRTRTMRGMNGNEYSSKARL